MKKLMIVMLLLSFVLMGCGSDFRYQNDRLSPNQFRNPIDITFETRGLFTAYKMNECADYETIVGNTILGVVFFPSIIAPVYFLGFSMYEVRSVDVECLAGLTKRELMKGQ